MPMTEPTTIGTIEHVDFPKIGLSAVPAKIDTGADSSSVWASDIREEGGELRFRLFGHSSPFYSGEEVVTGIFKVISVKNSFGSTELRYKVPMSIRLGGKTIKAQVTLSNRANNKYPVLIGRKTLQSRFVVDVARRPERSVKKILMLSSKWTPVTQQYADNITADSESIEVTYASYHDVDYIIGQRSNAFVLRESGLDIASYDFVYFKTTSMFMDVAASTARYLEKRGIPFMDEAIKHYPATSKLYQYALLEGSSMPVPESVFMLPTALAGSYDRIVQMIGLPFVLKDIHGNRGNHNYVVRDEASFTQACVMASEDAVQCVAQAFIPNICDYRVLVLGRKIRLVIKRSRQDESTHLNNTSQGALAEIVPTNELPPEVQKACLEAAELVERQVAGVDMVQDKVTGKWYCLEVNDGPQMASGSFVDEKHKAIASYLERKLA